MFPATTGWLVDGRVLLQTLRVHHPIQACIDVSTPRLISKREIGPRLACFAGNAPALVDMESHALADLSRQAAFPFVTLRSMSDALEDELDFDLSPIADDQGKIGIPQLIGTVFRNPGLIRSFFRLWMHSRTAAIRLGEAMPHSSACHRWTS
ncbi:MAG: hypothetical protein HGB17_17365 [Syntrophobacteraceae bacterium]|nr:hypothetical protein [Syntrophobacteraceae bacterium]